MKKFSFLIIIAIALSACGNKTPVVPTTMPDPIDSSEIVTTATDVSVATAFPTQIPAPQIMLDGVMSETWNVIVIEGSSSVHHYTCEYVMEDASRPFHGPGDIYFLYQDGYTLYGSESVVKQGYLLAVHCSQIMASNKLPIYLVSDAKADLLGIAFDSEANIWVIETEPTGDYIYHWSFSK